MADTGILKIARGIRNIVPGSGAPLPDIEAQVVVEEQHRHTVEVTEHPVQRGAPISDHMFRRPAELKLLYGWSDSASAADSGADSNTAVVVSSRDMLDAVLALQARSCLFDVVTGKRTYSNMLCQEVSFITDATTENAVMLSLSLRELILADVVVLGLAMDATTAPQLFASPVQQGPQQLQPTTRSVLP